MTRSPRPPVMGKYELRGLLGRGGGALVWKAFDSHLQRDVAIKVVRADHQQNASDVLQRFAREAQVIAKLSHPNIVQVYDVVLSADGADGPYAYMVMNYVEGMTLAAYLELTSRSGFFPSAVDLVLLFTALAAAVDYAHGQGVIHRDIKPANILLDTRNISRLPMGEPVLTDFGLGKVLHATAADSMPVSGMVVGTPLYIAPEQARGLAASARSDLYSLGIILYEMCTGQHPFQLQEKYTAQHPISLLYQHIASTPPAPSAVNPTVPPVVDAIILRALAKEPAERYPSASAMALELAQALRVPLPASFSLALGGPAVYHSDRLSMRDPPARGSTHTRVAAAQPTALGTGEKQQRGGGLATAPLLLASPALQHLSLSAWFFPRILGAHRFLQRGLFTLLSVFLLVLVLGAGLVVGRGARPFSQARITGSHVVGHLYFQSSGQVSQGSSQGISDEVELALSPIAAPAPGKSYFAWLQSDGRVSDAVAVPLGQLTLGGSGAGLSYRGDALHTNLLAQTSRLLITEEEAAVPPINPSPDQGAWRYVAQIPQQPNPADPMHFSLLDHLRHLLATDPKLDRLHLYGGLDYWLYRNTNAVLQYSVGARDDWNAQDAAAMHRQLVCILDYLDGARYVSDDLPPGTPLLIDSRVAQASLLEFDPARQDPPGYLTHVLSHLEGILNSPGVTATLRAQAQPIAASINQVNAWLQRVRDDARRLANMSDDQLFQQSASSTLDDLVTNANDAYAGSSGTTPGQARGGVTSIHSQLQHLSAMDVVPFNPQHG